MGVEIINLVNNTINKVLARLALVWVCKSLDNSLVISKDSQVLIRFIYSKLQGQGNPCKLGYIYYISNSLAKQFNHGSYNNYNS